MVLPDRHARGLVWRLAVCDNLCHGYPTDRAKRAQMTENALRLVRETGVTSFQDIITVLDTNLLRTKPTDWISERGEVKVKALYTIVGGRIVYQR